MKEKRIILAIFSAVLLFAGCGSNAAVYLETSGTEEMTAAVMEEPETEPVTEEPVSGGLCYVYVCGAVKTPGVYALPEMSRVYEAIQLAGGLAQDAAMDVINQAEFVSDGQMLRVPTEEEAQAAGTGSVEPDTGADGRVNINTAAAAELMTLPGVGQAKADAIIAYREAHGAFGAIEELMNVTGIKEGIFDQMKEYVKVN